MKKILIFLFALALCTPAFAVTETVTRISPELYRLNIAWTSDTGGAVSFTSRAVDGVVLYAVTDPGAVSPTALYDITVTDSAGVSVFGDALFNRSATATEAARPYAGDNGGGVPISGPLTIAVANAGDTKSGMLYIYYTTEPVAGSTPARLTQNMRALAPTTVLSSGESYTSDARDIRWAEGFFTARASVSALTSAAALAIEYQVSADGATWASPSTTAAPSTATAIAENLTNAGGPAADGEYAIQWDAVFASYFRTVCTNSGSGDLTATVDVEWR